MPDEPEFMRLQREFTRHLRNPEAFPAPGRHETRRLDIYRNATFANVAGLMADNYPRLAAVLTAEQWRLMVRDYIIRHTSRANAFVEVPAEFLAYLRDERDAPGDPPFMRELAHFDWLETLIGADQRRLDWTGIDRGGDPVSGVPVPNPIMRTIVYQFPVHVINPGYQPLESPARPTRIAAFRDPENRYAFVDLNDAAARLLELVIEDRGLTGAALLERMTRELRRTDSDEVTRAGREILERLCALGAVLGSRRY